MFGQIKSDFRCRSSTSILGNWLCLYKICPVWNKSNREHSYVGTSPSDTLKEADEAVKALNFKGQYFVDADHINLNNVSKYVETSDFFTLDVASFIGKESSPKNIDAFVASCKKYMGQLYISGIEKPLKMELIY